MFYHQDPEVAAAFQDISANPANIGKYQDNPKVKEIITKLSKKFGGGAGGAAPGGFPGFPGAGGAGGASGASDAGSASGSVPEQPDID